MTLITGIPVTNTAARKRIAASGGAMLTQTIILDYDVEKGIVYLPIAVCCWNIAGATSLASGEWPEGLFPFSRTASLHGGSGKA